MKTRLFFNPTCLWNFSCVQMKIKKISIGIVITFVHNCLFKNVVLHPRNRPKYDLFLVGIPKFILLINQSKF